MDSVLEEHYIDQEAGKEHVSILVSVDSVLEVQGQRLPRLFVFVSILVSVDSVLEVSVF